MVGYFYIFTHDTPNICTRVSADVAFFSRSLIPGKTYGFREKSDLFFYVTEKNESKVFDPESYYKVEFEDTRLNYLGDNTAYLVKKITVLKKMA